MASRVTERSTVTFCRRLCDDREFRERRGRLFVDGVRNVISAAQSGMRFTQLVRSRRLLRSKAGQACLHLLTSAGVPVVNVSPESYRKITLQPRASGLAGIIERPTPRLDKLVESSSACWTVLTRMRASGNLGTLLRTSDALGGHGLIVIGETLDVFNPAVVRSAMGAAYRQTVVHTTWAEFRHWRSRTGWTCVGATPDARPSFMELEYRRSLLLMLGDERAGLSSRQRDECDFLVRVPMAPGRDSINVSVAGALVLFEVKRQQGQPPGSCLKTDFTPPLAGGSGAAGDPGRASAQMR